MNPFRSLDDALVPRLARGLRRTVDATAGALSLGARSAQDALPRPEIEARVVVLRPAPEDAAPAEPVVEPAPTDGAEPAVEPELVPESVPERVPTWAPEPPAEPELEPVPELAPEPPVEPALDPAASVAREPVTANARVSRRRGPLRRLGRGARRRADRLDAHLSQRGVLGFVRDLPQAGFVVIGALIIVGALAVVHIDADAGGGSDATPGAPAAVAQGCPAGSLPPGQGAAVVGPVGDETVPAYLATTASTFGACLAADPGATFYAVISFDRLKTPADAAGALNGATVLDAFVDLAGETDSPRVLPLTGADDGLVRVTASITAAYAAAAGQFEQDGMLQSAQANSIVPKNAVEEAGKVNFQQAALVDAQQAHQLRVSCACTYGAVVVGRLSELATLRTSDVRAIDLAPAGTVASGLSGRPLLPTETATLSDAAEPSTVVAGSL